MEATTLRNDSLWPFVLILFCSVWWRVDSLFVCTGSLTMTRLSRPLSSVTQAFFQAVYIIVFLFVSVCSPFFCPALPCPVRISSVRLCFLVYVFDWFTHFIIISWFKNLPCSPKAELHRLIISKNYSSNKQTNKQTNTRSSFGCWYITEIPTNLANFAHSQVSPVCSIDNTTTHHWVPEGCIYTHVGPALRHTIVRHSVDRL